MTGSHDSGEVPAQAAPRPPPRARKPRSEPPRKPTVKVPRVQWEGSDRPPTFAATDSDPTPTMPTMPKSSKSSPALAAAPTGMAHLPVVPPPGISEEDTLDEPPPPALHPVTTPSQRPALSTRPSTGEYRFISSKPPKRDK